MKLRGVLFDMGGTLLHFTEPGKSWEDMEKLGALGVYRYLSEQNFSLPPESDALGAAWEYAHKMWTSLDSFPVTDLKLGRQLGLMARLWGVPDLAPETYDALALAYMTEVRRHVHPLDGAEETLRALHDQGLRIGLISNTVWAGPFHEQDLERYRLTPYFDTMVFSADVDLWKPHQEVFQTALKAMNLKAEEAAFVGDSLYFDVWGAQQAGMRGVWIRQPIPWFPDNISVTPDAVIQSLPELLGVVDLWR
jgi:putative hydrolase of the HAD superfamily